MRFVNLCFISYILDEYRNSMYQWTPITACELYESEYQTLDRSAASCGSGFQSMSTTTCVMGEFSDVPQNQEFCPPAGIIVQSCYIECPGKFVKHLDLR